MAVLQGIVLLALCVFTHSFPQDAPIDRNTIFPDERLKGEIFEKEDFSSIELASRDTTNPYRLPTTTLPRNYKVVWQILLPNRTFNGEVTIELYATQANVNEIVLHADDLEITDAELRLGNNVIPTSTFVVQKEYQFIRVPLASGSLQYQANNPVIYTLSCKFSAPLRTDMYGIYESWFRNYYTDEISWMASTQFQATAARYAFPCYDEPGFKATFDVTIRRPTAYRSWFNTKRARTENIVEGFQDDVYTTTPKMSTYLLALIVAEYKSTEDGGNVTTPLYEVIARPSAIDDDQGRYANEVGRELLERMSDHTGIDYYSVDSNLKMTQAAIPDFGAGAMENWGLLTYREAYVMYSPQHTNGYYKQIIAYILSHEITHMWYGNLVTCNWWDVTWLNEGFARYYQYFLTSWVEDKMGFETRFIVEQLHTSLLTDSSNNPQPLTNPGVGSPAAVSAMFSTITYNKGAAIIRQTEHLIGKDVQREGLTNYLVDRSFSTTEPMDLFMALKNASDLHETTAAYGSQFSFIEYFKSWTEHPGHPVINVQVNHQTGDMIITQRRFNINTGYSSINTNYIVPISFATASNPDFDNTKPSHMLTSTTAVINRGSVGDEWVILNKQATGYYRVNYDDYTWDLIILALRGPARTQINEYNRAQIVNDVFQFARAGLMTYKRALNILSFLEFETSYAPWVAAMTGFSWIRNRYGGSIFLIQIETLIRTWATAVMEDLKYDAPPPGEDFMRSYLRYQLAPVMCAMSDPTCFAAARTQFNNLLNGINEVHPDNRNWVYCNALRAGNQDDFTFLWDRFQQHHVYTEKILLLSVLGCTSHTQSLNTFLSAIIADTPVIRAQDYTTAWNSAVTGNEENTQKVFTFIQNNLPAVIDAFGEASTPLSYVSSRLRTTQEINAFVTWANSQQAVLGSSYQYVVNSAESMRQSIAWAETTQSDLNNYIVNGNENIQTTNAPDPIPPVDPVTTPQPILVEPEAPEIPGSGVAHIVSLFLLSVTVAAHFFM